jgi:hypothetical protein
MPLKERTLNIPVPKISFSQKHVFEEDDQVSPLLLSPQHPSGQHLAQTWKSPSQESHGRNLSALRAQTRKLRDGIDDDDDDISTVDPYADAIPVSTLLREPEWDKFEDERERKKRLREDRKVWSSTKKKRLTTRKERQALQFAVKQERIASHEKQELRNKKQRKQDERRRLEQRRNEQRKEEVNVHALQIDQGSEIASANRPMESAAFPKEVIEEGGRKTCERTPSTLSPYKRKVSSTPESRLSSGSATFGSFFSEATRQPENNPRARFPYGAPCLGCRNRICPNMRVVTTVKNMAIKHFESMVDKEFFYRSNQERRNAIYKIYKKHVNTKTIKNIPTCLCLMATDWFPSSPGNRNLKQMRDRSSDKQTMFSQETFNRRLKALTDSNIYS